MDVSLSELREMVMDREAWLSAIYGVTKSQTQLSNWTELNPLNLFLFMMLLLSYLEKQAGHTLKTEDKKSELEAI